MHKYDETLKNYVQSLKISQQAFGKRHVLYAETLRNIRMIDKILGSHQ